MVTKTGKERNQAPKKRAPQVPVRKGTVPRATVYHPRATCKPNKTTKISMVLCYATTSETSYSLRQVFQIRFEEEGGSPAEIILPWRDRTLDVAHLSPSSGYLQRNHIPLPLQSALYTDLRRVGIVYF